MGKRVVVLGGAGLIGTHLCLRLLKEGNEVYCVDVRDHTESYMLAEADGWLGFRHISHNIINSFTIRCDQIYNLSTPAQLRYNHSLPVEVLKVNILGAINALDAARTEHARLLYASSGDIYGMSNRESFPSENSRLSHGVILTEGKLAGEALHRAYQAQYDLDIRIARIFNTYGSGFNIDDQRAVMKMIVAALQNKDIELYGSGEQLRTFCWVGDMVDGLIKLMDAARTEEPRTVSLGGSLVISICALAEKIVEITASRSHIIKTPPRCDDSRRQIPNLSAAEHELGWCPTTTLDEGLKRTVEYAERMLAHNWASRRSWIEMNN